MQNNHFLHQRRAGVAGGLWRFAQADGTKQTIQQLA
jgi:hypothetical protein